MVPLTMEFVYETNTGRYERFNCEKVHRLELFFIIEGLRKTLDYKKKSPSGRPSIKIQ